ncbi:MAG: CsgE family curli-type amyloid fiber assembly protein [Pseudomonadota bacterium]
MNKYNNALAVINQLKILSFLALVSMLFSTGTWAQAGETTPLQGSILGDTGQQTTKEQPSSRRGNASEPNDESDVSSMNEALTEEQLEELLGKSLKSSELGGVFVDRTVTMAGRSFYKEFSQLAMEKPIFSEITLTVYERPDARWGSQVWVNEGNNVFYRSILSPRLTEADEAARQAVDAVEEQVVQQRLAQALYSDRDLAPVEF